MPTLHSPVLASRTSPPQCAASPPGSPRLPRRSGSCQGRMHHSNVQLSSADPHPVSWECMRTGLTEASWDPTDVLIGLVGSACTWRHQCSRPSSGLDRQEEDALALGHPRHRPSHSFFVWKGMRHPCPHGPEVCLPHLLPGDACPAGRLLATRPRHSAQPLDTGVSQHSSPCTAGCVKLGFLSRPAPGQEAVLASFT